MTKNEVPLSVLVQYFRVPTGDIPVDYPGREVLLGSRITNISKTGVFIRTTNPLPKEATTEISFSLPGSKAEIRAAVIVRWSSAGQKDSDTPGMGVEFTKISGRNRKAIERFVEEFVARMRRG